MKLAIAISLGAALATSGFGAQTLGIPYVGRAPRLVENTNLLRLQ